MKRQSYGISKTTVLGKSKQEVNNEKTAIWYLTKAKSRSFISLSISYQLL